MVIQKSHWNLFSCSPKTGLPVTVDFPRRKSTYPIFASKSSERPPPSYTSSNLLPGPARSLIGLEFAEIALLVFRNSPWRRLTTFYHDKAFLRRGSQESALEAPPPSSSSYLPMSKQPIKNHAVPSSSTPKRKRAPVWPFATRSLCEQALLVLIGEGTIEELSPPDEWRIHPSTEARGSAFQHERLVWGTDDAGALVKIKIRQHSQDPGKTAGRTGFEGGCVSSLNHSLSKLLRSLGRGGRTGARAAAEGGRPAAKGFGNRRAEDQHPSTSASGTPPSAQRPKPKAEVASISKEKQPARAPGGSGRNLFSFGFRRIQGPPARKTPSLDSWDKHNRCIWIDDPARPPSREESLADLPEIIPDSEEDGSPPPCPKGGQVVDEEPPSVPSTVQVGDSSGSEDECGGGASEEAPLRSPGGTWRRKDGSWHPRNFCPCDSDGQEGEPTSKRFADSYNDFFQGGGWERRKAAGAERQPSADRSPSPPHRSPGGSWRHSDGRWHPRNLYPEEPEKSPGRSSQLRFR